MSMHTVHHLELLWLAAPGREQLLHAGILLLGVRSDHGQQRLVLEGGQRHRVPQRIRQRGRHHVGLCHTHTLQVQQQQKQQHKQYDGHC